jgi:hypothetical protein
MINKDLAELNFGRDLDEICCLDPRGYGVCRILQDATRKLYGGSAAMHCAKELSSRLQEGDSVFFLTGFVLIPYGKAETDGITGTVAVIHALSTAFGIKPTVFCPSEAVSGIAAIAKVFDMEPLITDDPSKSAAGRLCIVEFPKDCWEAAERATSLITAALPKACISIEAPGANTKGAYHNSTGKSVTSYEAKLDILFAALQLKGVYTVSIGDLGNEIGLGVLESAIRDYVPGAAPGSCSCGCGGSIVAETKADSILTATVSDWGAYALCGALAWLKDDISLMPSENRIADALTAASTHGLIDMTGREIPAVDGCDLDLNKMIAGLMWKLVSGSQAQAEQSSKQFDAVSRLGYFSRKDVQCNDKDYRH